MVTSPSLLWPVRPKPLTGEALSSWLLRVADSNGLDQRSFKRYLPKVHGTSADLDLIDDEAFFNAIAIRCAIAPENISSLGFARDEGLVFIRNATSHLDWIIPRIQLGTWPEKRHISSQPYCPACLASDVTPYYRKVWRYAFHPICPKHGLLVDHCPNCGHSFSYLALGSATWSRYGIHALRHCTACGTPFTTPQHVTFDTLEQRVLATQSVLMEGLETGWISHDNKSIPIALFLRGLHILAETLLNPDHGNSISNWIAVHHPELPSHEPNCLGEGNLEHQPSPARARLLVLAYWLALDWPKRWIALIQQTGISATACLPHMNRLPAWMHSEEFEQSRTREQARSHDEVVAAKRLLTHLRGWPANNAELTRFMNTGIAPPLKPRSQPISPDVHQYFSRLQQTTPSNTTPPQKQNDRINQSSVRELYSPAQADEHLSELLEDMDDTETSLPTLKRQQRNQRGRS